MSDGAGDAGFEALIEFLKRSRGFDFTGYKRPSLERRLNRRMQAVGCESYGDYLDFLEVHPDEFAQLFDTLLINVTSFFRDAAAWERLQHDVLPGVVAARDPDEPFRAWIAGCASGEEAYSVAMVLHQVLGDRAYREHAKIYATDIDDDALNRGRQAVYTAKQLEPLADGLREQYFEHADQRYAFRQDLRRNVIFGRNNLLEDAPIARLHLLVCRNTLMYFTAEMQSRIMRHFHFALRDGGVLMLGKSEMMLTHRDMFDAVDLRQRIFRRVPRPAGLQTRLARQADDDAADVPLAGDERSSRDAALEVGQQPLLIVSPSGLLTFANVAARALFRLPLDALGKPFRDMGLSSQPVDLRTPIDEALRDRRRVVVGEAAFKPEKGEERRLEITVTPLLAHGGTVLGVSVVFEDVSRYAAAKAELEANRRDLELAYDELRSTIDELETTNEELQSANEELQTTNEELQATNEELETTNEELQSTNEELETINDELRGRTAELNDVNEFLEAILAGLGLAVAVVDRDQKIQIWNQGAEELWGMREEEALERQFLALDIGLPTEQLAPGLRAVLGGDGEPSQIELEAVNRRGRTIRCTTTIMPLISPNGEPGRVRGAIVLMQDGPAEDDGPDGASAADGA